MSDAKKSTDRKKKRPFDIEEAIVLLREAVAPYPKAALFELAGEGHTSVFEILVACIISIRTRLATVSTQPHRLVSAPALGHADQTDGETAVTEHEWQACRDVHEMRRHLHSEIGTHTNPTLRREYLFGIACCDCVRHLLIDERSHLALHALARHAEDPMRVPFDEEETTRELAEYGEGAVARQQPSSKWAAWAVINVAQGLSGTAAIHAAAALSPGGLLHPSPEANALFAHLLRDIWGNPFRPVAADPAWLTSTVIALAGGIYAERAFDRMPILADALQDAGCDNPDILNHCRSDGPHVRGCWVVDLLLGKE